MNKHWLWTPVLLVGLAAGAYGVFRILQPPPLPPGFLYGNGHVEATEVRIGAEVTGRVLESRLVEGQAVEAGALLVRIDDADLQATLAQARAELDALQKERAVLDAELRTWRHHRRTARSDLARYRELERAGTIPPQRLDQARNAFEEARGRVQMLEKKAGVIDDRIEAARRQVERIRLQLDRTRIRAPIAGTVLVKGVEVGELVVPGQVVAVLADLSRLELKIYVPEKAIGKVRLGADARVRVDAFPQRRFEARVSRVDARAQFTPRDIHMPEERVRMVFGVTLSVANPEGYLKPGMPADAWLRVRDDAPWPERLIVPR